MPPAHSPLYAQPGGQSERGLTQRIFVGLGLVAFILVVALVNVLRDVRHGEESARDLLIREGYLQRGLPQQQQQQQQTDQGRRADAAAAPPATEPPEVSMDLTEDDVRQDGSADPVALNTLVGPQRWNVDGGIHFERGGLQGDIVGADDFEIEDAPTPDPGGKQGGAAVKDVGPPPPPEDQVTRILPGWYRKRGDTLTFQLKQASTDQGKPTFSFLFEGKEQEVKWLAEGEYFKIQWPEWGTAPFRIARDGTGDLVEHDKFRFVRSADGMKWPARAKTATQDSAKIMGGPTGVQAGKPYTKPVPGKELRERCGIDSPKKPGPDAWSFKRLHRGVPDRTTDPPTPRSDLPNAEEVQAKMDADPNMPADAKAELQRDAVIEAMRSAWRAYDKYAWGLDELKPNAKTGHQWVGGKGTGISIVDSLGTLWLMGLREEFEKARQWTENGGLNYNAAGGVSHFEATIRYVGGLLSAYEMSGEKHYGLVRKAEELVERLLSAYRGMSGIPKSQVNLRTRATSNWAWAKGGAVLAEFMTIQLEFRTLSYHTKNPLYDMRAQWVTDVIMDKCAEDKLCNTFYDIANDRFFQGSFTRVCLGAHGDSYFEYLLKQHLLTGQREDQYRRWWEESAVNLVNKVAVEIPGVALVLTEGRRTGDPNVFTKSHNMEHLACFAGGMYGLGALVYEDSPNRELLMRAAVNLTDTCRMMYSAWDSHIGPEVATIRPEGISTGVAHYLLRPEYVESLFLMWRITKDQRYRDWGWDAFYGMYKNCRAPGSGGFSGVKDVRKMPCVHDDVQQSFFLAETLKYLFLLFADDSITPLDRWVFNTEAHPLRIRERNPHDLWPSEVLAKRKQQQALPVAERTRLHRAGRAWVTEYEKDQAAAQSGHAQQPARGGPAAQPAKRPDKGETV
eukprot:TRINITY_DN5387_c0_g2_i1.p1 TRINITY_DN5387_c0_g2~~TRINITY_DN5387_c0_g2_i1.p1  ORF type:complete len:936 (+),score=370.41 TRINITY_DN5387_c0_g2_i1:100-2808(+)